MRLAQLFSCLFFLFGIASLQANQEPRCFSLESKEIKLIGIVRWENFKDAEQKSEKSLILYLSKKICVKKGNDEFLQNNLIVDKVQLVPNNEKIKDFNFEKKKVLAIGTLFSAHTAHHHMPILLSLDRIEMVK
ncbi:MAG: DUF4431 domain-containing protein [Elusimicrobiota bacterium]